MVPKTGSENGEFKNRRWLQTRLERHVGAETKNCVASMNTVVSASIKVLGHLIFEKGAHVLPPVFFSLSLFIFQKDMS